MERKTGGKFHLKLNMARRPIANKYCEGKLKTTLKRELKEVQIVKGEPLNRRVLRGGCDLGGKHAQGCCGQFLDWFGAASNLVWSPPIITLLLNQRGWLLE